MSYEYENINRAIVQQNGVDNNINRANSLQELDEVYRQATKADEYEAKAKAFDRYKAHMERHIAGEVNEEEFVSDLKSDYFESGESDAKK